MEIPSSYEAFCCPAGGPEKYEYSFSLFHTELDHPTAEDATELCVEGASMEKTDEEEEETIDDVEGL